MMGVGVAIVVRGANWLDWIKSYLSLISLVSYFYILSMSLLYITNIFRFEFDFYKSLSNPSTHLKTHFILKI